MPEKVVTFNPDNMRYCSLSLERRGDRLTMSGDCGEVIKDEDLEKRVEDYWNDIDIEDEFGYLADEQHIEEDRRKDYFERLEEDLKRDAYPYEIYRDIYKFKIEDSVDFTLDSAGQLYEDICKPGVKTTGNPFYLAKLCEIWDKHHLKDADESVHADANRLIKKFPDFEDFADDWIEKKVNVKELKKSHYTRDIDRW